MGWLILVGSLVVLLFSFVIAFGAPYLPTLKTRVNDALDLLNLHPDQTLLELGSGDGRMAIAAAKRGWLVVGYELNPLLVIYSRVRCWRYHRQIKIIWGNYWHAKLPPANGIYVFLLNPYMAKLHKKITHSIIKDTRVVSFAFAIPGQKVIKENNGLLLYQYYPQK